MTILVTGGAGYIGSHTVLELIKLGYDVITFDNLQKGYEKAVLGGKFIKGDLLNIDDLVNVFSKYKIDSVIHFAADSLVGESMQKPDKYFTNNLIGSINLLNIMVKYNVKRIIFSSTAAVYGEPDKIPIEEDNLTIPTNTYGESKLAFEKILRWYDIAYGIKYISLRYFNAAGADKSGKIGECHNPETHLIPIILLTVLGKLNTDDNCVKIYGDDYNTPDGTCIRDYIHVTDLSIAHILALKKLEEKNSVSKIYNLGNGKGFSVKEIIKVAEQVTGKKIKTKVIQRRAGDPAILIASSDKIKRELNWNPQFNDIHTIIESAWNWHKKHPDGYK